MLGRERVHIDTYTLTESIKSVVSLSEFSHSLNFPEVYFDEPGRKPLNSAEILCMMKR